MLDSRYDHKNVEGKIYKLWEKSGYFNPDNLAGKGRPYVVYMPLPNVTGTLHMGHALNNTLQDILIRYHRLKGFKTLWLPGTDHAGIATQYVVEKELLKRGINRFELGREKFIEEVWNWKNKYGNIILEQLKKLGCSADWSRTRFTMDKEYSKDVIEAFKHYHQKGWIYKGRRTVNWCPRCATSLSELELEYEDEKATLYYIKYGPFTLATVRPETKFGDTALAVNPRDKRYQKYVGKTLTVESLDTAGTLEKPTVKKITLQVVADEAVDPKFGTGVIKVTPAHDLTDFEIGERHKLPIVDVIDKNGRMNERAGKYAGLKVKEAREKIASDLKAVGLLLKEEPYEHRVAKCYRCGTVIEPLPSEQWFLKMKELAKMAERAVRSGKVKIIPKNFEKPYFDWLKNIRDWTISRQIWWGHRLPVWQCKCRAEINSKFEIRNSKLKRQERPNYIVSANKPKNKCPLCQSEYEQVPDVLDTWFSSALWPFAGLSAADLKKYYPGNALITARDILNLWVARMIFSGLEFRKKVPFSKVFINGTILTKEGKRMSKSKGTGVDPLNYIDRFGADATRFGIVLKAAGQDIRWDESALEAGKKFANKTWNIARFIFMNRPSAADLSAAVLTQEDRKNLNNLKQVKKQIAKHLEKFEFHLAAEKLYRYIWHEFADKIIEAAKPRLRSENRADKAAASKTIETILYESLKMLHPFMPYVTEEIYQNLPFRKEKTIMIERW